MVLNFLLALQVDVKIQALAPSYIALQAIIPYTFFGLFVAVEEHSNSLSNISNS
jgi:hypothetical protein